MPLEEVFQHGGFFRIIRKWGGWVTQPHLFNDLSADVVKGFALQVIIPIVIAHHVMKTDFDGQHFLALKISFAFAVCRRKLQAFSAGEAA